MCREIDSKSPGRWPFEVIFGALSCDEALIGARCLRTHRVRVRVIAERNNLVQLLGCG
jgi:hypothetical protein